MQKSSASWGSDIQSQPVAAVVWCVWCKQWKTWVQLLSCFRNTHWCHCHEYALERTRIPHLVHQAFPVTLHLKVTLMSRVWTGSSLCLALTMKLGAPKSWWLPALEEARRQGNVLSSVGTRESPKTYSLKHASSLNISLSSFGNRSSRVF